MDAKRAAILLVTVAGCAVAAVERPGAAADTPNLAGRWQLNHSLSRIPEEIGFGMDLLGSGPDSAGGRGETSGTNPAAMALFRESADDAARRDHLVNEVRRPPEELAITQTLEAVIIAADGGRPRTFTVDGREAIQKLGLVSVGSSGRWDGARFEVRYKVQEGREVRYEYARTENPPRLTAEVRFVERGGHDSATLVYEPATAGSPPRAPATAAAPSGGGAPPPAGAPSGAAAPPSLGGLGQAARGGGLTQLPPSRPALPTLAPPIQQEASPGAVRPDAALAGLTQLGMVVEELRPQAAACGLAQAPLEAIVSKAFTDAGMKVTKDSDEDTYVYVDIGTTNVNAGLCVSRYDVYLFTNTMAKLSYQAAPVLVQVQLLHQGGLAGGAPTAHGESVRKNVKQAVDEFASRIRTASSR